MIKLKPKIRLADELKIFCVCLCVTLGAIVILETVALLKGVDGTMFGASMAAIGVVGGSIGTLILKAYLGNPK